MTSKILSDAKQTHLHELIELKILNNYFPLYFREFDSFMKHFYKEISRNYFLHTSMISNLYLLSQKKTIVSLLIQMKLTNIIIFY